MKPDTYERLQQQLFAKFSSFPEIGHTDIGVTMRNDAFVAFLDAPQLIATDVADIPVITGARLPMP